MKHYVCHDDTGAIRQSGYYDDDQFDEVMALNDGTLVPGYATLEIAPLASVIEHATLSESSYVEDGQVLPKKQFLPSMTRTTMVADTVDVFEITNLPIPCMVQLSGAITAGPFEVDDGVLELTCDAKGQLTIKVTAEPQYLPWSCTVDAA